MLKIFSLMGALGGAATLSQYPEFSQQYTQRLAGQVDALTVVVTDFEASAMRAGLTRTQAFEQMVGTQFLEDRQRDMRRTFARHAALTDNLAELRAASPLARLAMPQRLLDTETISKTWADFKPAMPLTPAGIVSAGVGGLFGWATVAALFAFIASLVRNRPKAAPVIQTQRKEPALHRAAEVPNVKQPLVGRR